MANKEDVINAFFEHRKKTGSHFFTDGYAIWSYGEHFPIALWEDGDIIAFNEGSYSKTTATHKNAVKREMDKRHIGFHIVSTEQLREKVRKAEMEREKQNKILA